LGEITAAHRVPIKFLYHLVEAVFMTCRIDERDLWEMRPDLRSECCVDLMDGRCVQSDQMLNALNVYILPARRLPIRRGKAPLQPRDKTSTSLNTSLLPPQITKSVALIWNPNGCLNLHVAVRGRTGSA
jgi:hypothetical protein